MSSDYEQLVQKLVMSGTLNVEERKRLDDCSMLPIPKAHVAMAVTKILEDVGIFPQTAVEQAGTAIHEGYVLERLDDGRIELRCQRHQAINPLELAEAKTVEVFPEVAAAILRFIELEWPRGIDGVALQ